MFGVIIGSRKTRKIHRFKTRKEAEEKLASIKSKDKHLISLLHPIFPEEGFKLKKGSKLWCCYCGAVREFGFKPARKTLGAGNCEVCGISTSDFYIRKINKLW